MLIFKLVQWKDSSPLWIQLTPSICFSGLPALLSGITAVLAHVRAVPATSQEVGKCCQHVCFSDHPWFCRNVNLDLVNTAWKHKSTTCFVHFIFFNVSVTVYIHPFFFKSGYVLGIRLMARPESSWPSSGQVKCLSGPGGQRSWPSPGCRCPDW